MSPEQAGAGRSTGARTSGRSACVLFEMLAGERPFTGETNSDTLAAVLKTEPDWRALPADTPLPIRRLLRRCLEKDRQRRLDSAAAARLEIDDAIAPPAAEPLRAGGGAVPSRDGRGDRGAGRRRGDRRAGHMGSWTTAPVAAHARACRRASPSYRRPDRRSTCPAPTATSRCRLTAGSFVYRVGGTRYRRQPADGARDRSTRRAAARGCRRRLRAVLFAG